jgi:hypothetical protein
MSVYQKFNEYLKNYPNAAVQNAILEITGIIDTELQELEARIMEYISNNVQFKKKIEEIEKCFICKGICVREYEIGNRFYCSKECVRKDIDKNWNGKVPIPPIDETDIVEDGIGIFVTKQPRFQDGGCYCSQCGKYLVINKQHTVEDHVYCKKCLLDKLRRK